MEPHKIEAVVSLLARLLVSLVMPAWGVMIASLGVWRMSLWWIVCGAAIIGVGLVLSLGGPLLEPFLREP